MDKRRVAVLDTGIELPKFQTTSSQESKPMVECCPFRCSLYKYSDQDPHLCDMKFLPEVGLCPSLSVSLLILLFIGSWSF